MSSRPVEVKGQTELDIRVTAEVCADGELQKVRMFARLNGTEVEVPLAEVPEWIRDWLYQQHDENEREAA